MDWLHNSLRFFPSDLKRKILSSVSEERFNLLAADVKNKIEYLFSQVSKETSEKRLGMIADCLIKSVLFTDPVWIFVVNEGSNFSLKLKIPKTVNETIFDGKIPVAREDEQNTLLSVISSSFFLPEETDPDLGELFVVEVTFDDLDLTEDMFYRTRVQIERTDQNGQPTGDATVQLALVYLIVETNIDDE